MKTISEITGNFSTPEVYSEPNLRWIFLQKQLKAENCSVFSQKAPSQMFDWVLDRILFFVKLLLNLPDNTRDGTLF